DFRVVDGDLALERAITDSLPTLDNPHLITMRPTGHAPAFRARLNREIPGFRNPGTVVVAIRFDNKRIVVVPMSHGISHPPWLRRILRKYAAVGPDRSPGMAPFDKLQRAIRHDDEFNSIVVAE